MIQEGQLRLPCFFQNLQRAGTVGADAHISPLFCVAMWGDVGIAPYNISSICKE